jgi:two-component system KDP operon response regulator KdpE
VVDSDVIFCLHEPFCDLPDGCHESKPHSIIRAGLILYTSAVIVQLSHLTWTSESTVAAMRVLIIDDDPAVRETYASKLASAGYEVLVAADGVDGLRVFHEEQPDLVVVDMVMPEMDGLTVVRRVREFSQTPILIFTAQATQEDEIIEGLEAGADEYLVKPVRLNEFAARIQALLRRAQPNAQTTEPISYDDGHLRIDLVAREVTVGDERLHLTPTEFKLLAVLLENAGRVVLQRDLLEKVWGPEYVDDIYYPRVYVSQLRRKIEVDPGNPLYIITEHRVGYRFEKQITG